jgi:ribosomal protein S18 acetylase RimI-like enzyme
MVEIRKARLSDLTTLAALEREFYRDQRAIVLKQKPELRIYLQQAPGGQHVLRKRMRHWIRSRNAVVFIAEANSRAIGFLTVSIDRTPPPWLPARRGFLGYVFVKRRYRGQRISSMLMEMALAWLAERKIKHVCLTVIEDNKPARAIWKKWGFYDFIVVAWKLGGPAGRTKLLAAQQIEEA